MAEQENVCPQAWGGRAGGLARELRRLAARPPPGVKLLLREDDLSDVTALIEGPDGTPYAGGVFRVRLSLERFPLAAPRARFETRIFHPNVSAAGDVCVSTLARDWRPQLGLAHALLAVRCLLIAPNHDSALNEEAASLLRDRYDDYFQRARLYTEIHAKHDHERPPSPASACPSASTDTLEADGAPSSADGDPAGAARDAHAGAARDAHAGAARDAHAGAARTAHGGAQDAPARPRAKRSRRPSGPGGAAGGPGGAAERARERRRILKRL